MSTSKIFSILSLSKKKGCVVSFVSSRLFAIEVKMSQEYSAYKRDAKVEATARFIFEAATSSIALVIFLVLFTDFILFFIALLFDIHFFFIPRLHRYAKHCGQVLFISFVPAINYAFSKKPLLNAPI